MPNQNLTIPEGFLKSATRNKEKPAFIFYRNNQWKSFTYGELINKINAITDLLKVKGVKRKDRIAIYSENMPEWCISYLAISSTGAVCVPLDAELGSNEVYNLLKHSDVKIVFSSQNTYKNVLKIIDKNKIISFDSEEFITASEEDLSSTDQYLHMSTPDDIASIIYTSGTTGEPKGVILTHKNFYSDALSIIESGLIGSGDIILSILPLQHTYPFMCTFIVPLLIGATIVYPSGLKGPELTNTIRDKKASVFIGVPQLLEMILKGIETKINEKGFLIKSTIYFLLRISSILRRNFNINLGKSLFKTIHKTFGSQFRFFASGGARLKPETMKRLESYGFTILEGYGLTETSPVVTFNPPGKNKPGSAGKPLKKVQIRIDRGKGPEGEILIQGPMVMKGYYRMEEETRKVLKDGWLHTGDTGFIDRNGYLFITGRKKEVIVLGTGKNVYPEDVEREYSTLPLVKEICVYGREEDGTQLHALIVPDTEYAKRMMIGNIYESMKWDIYGVSLKLPQHMRIKGFQLYGEAFPKTSLGKIKRFLINEIVEKLEKKEGRKPGQKVVFHDNITQQITESIREVTTKDIEIQLDDSLELDIGLDSLKRIELIVKLESRFGITLPESFGAEFQTVNDLAEGIKNYIDASQQPFFTVKESETGLKQILEKQPSPDVLTNIRFARSFLGKRMLFLNKNFLRLVFRILFRSRISGIKNLIQPPFIICPNHSSYIDAFLLGTMLPESILLNTYILGAQKYFNNPLTKRFAKATNVIPIDPDTFLTKALNLSAYLLNNGKALCIFPEGGRTFDGNIGKFKKGIGILAIECGVPIIPVFIKGSYEALPRGKFFPKLKKLSIDIGKPVYPEMIKKVEGQADFDKYQWLADIVREKVLELSSF